MRLAGQVKGGYYPAPPEAVAHMASFLSCPDPANTTLLDPCCGQAAAIDQLRLALGVPPERNYLIELDANRSETARERLPQAKLLAKADFIGTETSARSLSLAWTNSPFDDELGGGRRVELKFLAKVTPLLVAGGILCFILPETVLQQKADIRSYLLSHYREITVQRFPDEHRPFREVCVLGVKRSSSLDGSMKVWNDEVGYDVPADYVVPAAAGPARFQKSAFTEEELCEALGKARSLRVLGVPAPLPLPRPGLQLGQGQQALVLAGGFLNRVLQLEGRPPILIKASPYKTQVHKGTTVEELEGGATKSVTIISEKIGLRVRVLDVTGLIHDLADTEDKANEEGADAAEPTA